jgi:hypothetical protein
MVLKMAVAAFRLQREKTAIRVKRRMGIMRLSVSCLVAVGACCAVGCGQGATSAEEPLGTTSQALNDVHFGIHAATDGAPDYQAVPGQPSCGWKMSLTNVSTMSQNFDGQFSYYATKDYHYDIVGKAYFWEIDGDQATNSLDTVDLFFTFTHGQAAPRPAYTGDCRLPSDPADNDYHSTWAMWNNQSHARSDWMKLGDEARGLSVFASYSCETQKWDAFTWYRWSNIFSGGLRMAVGFYGDTPYCIDWTPPCLAQYQHGTMFAYYLGNSWTVSSAWLYAFDDNDGRYFPAIAYATGNSPSDCATRRDAMTMADFRNYPRRQWDMSTMCATYWYAD